MNVSCWEHFQRLFDRGNLKKTTEWRSGSVPWHDAVGKDGMKDVISPGQVEEQTSKTGSKMQREICCDLKNSTTCLNT